MMSLIWMLKATANGQVKDCLQKRNGRRLGGEQMAGYTHGEVIRQLERRILLNGQRKRWLLLQLAVSRRMSVLTEFTIWREISLNGHLHGMKHIRAVSLNDLNLEKSIRL